MVSSSTVRAGLGALEVEALEHRYAPSTASFVNGLYVDLLHRQPQPAEMATWSSALNNGTSRAQVAQAIVSSPEHQNLVIQNDYLTLLGRPPSPAEIPTWSSQLQAGISEQQVKAAILASDEFFSRVGNTTTAWLNGVYQNVLGRAVDPTGAAAWNAALQAGLSRQTIATDIMNSNEGTADQVVDAYRTLLRRTPDPVGLATWQAALQQGMTTEQLTVAIATSPEFESVGPPPALLR